MSDVDKNAILIRALEASGSDREAQLARAILGDPAATPAAPAQPAEPAPGQQAGELPPGILSLEQIAAWEQQPRAKSYAEQQERFKMLDQVTASLEYHAERS